MRDYDRISSRDAAELVRELEKIYPRVDKRLIIAIISMHVGGHQRRLEDPDIEYWTNWAGIKTYRTFNSFPQLSERELAFVFYAIGKVFVPLLLHERGVKSESFKNLTPEEQEKAVMEELEVVWENHLIRILQVIPFLALNSKTM
ncbi:MAG: DUF3467 domain-containing protein [Aquificaceae bacterium]|nr:DUF3467 domain-containing protein [Aquificaceae bacterium]